MKWGMCMNTYPKLKKITKPEQSNCGENPSPDATESANQPIILPTPNELVSLLSTQVIGHEQAKKTVAVAAYQHLIQCARSDIKGGRVEAENHVLLAGPSGSGKSLLLRTLRDVLNIPVFHIACTNIVPNGYKGKDFAHHIESIAERVVDDDFTHPAVVIWDEVDKLALFESNDSHAAIYKRMSQMDFLTFLDGTQCGDDGRMDSSRILSVACGAFVGLDSLRKPKSAPVIGFHSGLHGKSPTLMEPLQPDHLIQYGLIPEFVGRFSRLAHLDTLDQMTIRRILTEADNNVLARRKEFYDIHGIRLEVTDDALDALVTKAMALNTGARALRVVIDQTLSCVEHRLPDMARSGVTSVVIDRDAVLGLSSPIEHKNGEAKSQGTLLELRRFAAYSDNTKPSADGSDLAFY